MGTFTPARVLSVRHWTERLFSFTTTREAAFRFTSGQFVMLGLMVDGRPLMRAYSIASSPYAAELEFFSIKVPDGALTSRLQHIRPGEPVLVGGKPTGTLVLQNLLPGRTLWLLGTGTGLAPYLSIVRDVDAYARYERIVLVHGVRQVRELAYAALLRDELPRDEFLGEAARTQLVYCPTVTREPFIRTGRIPELISSGRLCTELHLPAPDPAHDRCMICGSPSMLADTRAVLEARGFQEGNMTVPGTYVIERAFVER